jgi:hypothetical protein
LRRALPGLALHDHTPQDEVASRVAGCTVVLVNKLRITREIIESTPSLKLIALAATGTNNVDLETARSRGIAVCNLRDYCTTSVVQHTLGVLLLLTQKLREYDALVRRGAWQQGEQFCLLDYPKMSRAMDPLKSLIEATDRVEIEGPGTRLAFSIKGLPAVKCDGHRNVPDGEVYTAPVRDSVEGVVTYNAATLHGGTQFRNIRFAVEKGRIREATIIGVIAMMLAVILGKPLAGSALGHLFLLTPHQLVIALGVYGFFASVLPVWLLLAPVLALELAPEV